MKLFDNLLDKMKLSSDDDEYEDDDMMDDDEVEEERVSRRMRKASTKEDTYDDDDEEEKVEKVRPRKNVSERQAKSSSNKIVNLRWSQAQVWKYVYLNLIIMIQTAGKLLILY